MCPKNKCGPLCREESPSCKGEDNYYQYIRLPYENETLINFTSPETPSCPSKCCSDENEYCYRTHDSSGNEVSLNQEMMLIFGGVSEIDVKIGDKKVLEECDNLDSNELFNIRLY